MTVPKIEKFVCAKCGKSVLIVPLSSNDHCYVFCSDCEDKTNPSGKFQMVLEKHVDAVKKHMNIV